MKRIISTMVFLVMVLAVQSSLVQAQTTEFTYQGSLSTSGSPASGNYDFEFALFDALAGGTQIGSTLTRSTVAVASGTFAVRLDFGSQFPGANRFLEIRVRTPGGGAFTTLAPRQSVNSSPYAVKSLNSDNATQLGGVAANQYVTTSSGNASYVQNTTSPQTANFNISGNGTAGGTLSGNIVNATTQYNIGGNRVLSNPGTNLFAGVLAGTVNTGQWNSFFGSSAGEANTTGSSNAFFGNSAGFWNTNGYSNAFFGTSAGFYNTSGFYNAFFGTSAGQSNTTGNNNAFFGRAAGYSNSAGGDNSFFGMYAGFSNATGFNNSFFGKNAGLVNTTGINNTMIGTGADVSTGGLSNATAIGFAAVVDASNKVRIGNGSVTVIEGQVAYTFSSDKNLKENFLAVNGRDVLQKIRGFNMTSWNYIGQDAKAFRHYGPMAQDFYAAFGKDKFGAFGSPTTINTGDMSGVMLAAIKELSMEKESQQKQIERQQAEIDALKALVCSQNVKAAICQPK